LFAERGNDWAARLSRSASGGARGEKVASNRH
jgi:hypothetical protein